MSLGFFVYRFRWWIIGAWALVVAALLAFVPSEPDTQHESIALLPPSAPSRQASEMIRKSFPDSGGLGEAAIIFERTDDMPLDSRDLSAIDSLAVEIGKPQKTKLSFVGEFRIRTPRMLDIPGAQNPLLSPDKKAALVLVSIPYDFVTMRSARMVDHIELAIDKARDRKDWPANLDVVVTGASAFGRDYAVAALSSHQKTLYVTLISVIVILMLVYRAPLAALIPIIGISAAAIIALRTMVLTAPIGIHAGTAERIFVLVLLYGAGVDYSLLYISRVREFIETGSPMSQAAPCALVATFPAIAASAATNVFGLLMLCFAQFAIFRTTGPATALALTVALLAAVTLVPALVSVVGARAFWPASKWKQKRRIWPFVARVVTTWPALVLLVTLAAVAVPAWRGANQDWVYDTLAMLKPQYPSARGVAMATRHWPVGAIGPLTVVIDSPTALTDKQWKEASVKVRQGLTNVPGVSTVRSFDSPLGGDSPVTNYVTNLVARSKIHKEYISPTGMQMRMTVVQESPPLSLQAMQTLEKVRHEALAAASATISASAGQVKVYVAGVTSEIWDVRTTTRDDFRLVSVLVLAAILLIVTVLLRDLILAVFMVASTIMSYFATLGITYWVFTAMGYQGLDWKVEVFLFVVMVAVGQDYNIFLASRLSQEARRLAPVPAAFRAVVRTGPVISSCGIIMAATLGSLMAGDLKLLLQLGFAFALGMMIDTFIVRPVLLPSFVVLTGRTGRRGRVADRGPCDTDDTADTGAAGSGAGKP